jgi:cell division septation protein DedD
MQKVTWYAASALLLLSVALLPMRLAAGEPNQAGLVVQFGDGLVETRCIALEEAEISGADLLARSGLDVVIDASSGMGITVCRIQEVGCAHPSEPCFCQCMGGGECAYWNYFYLEPGETEWTYSALGAVLRKVAPGSVEAWVWGDGRTPPADDLLFDAVCTAPSPTPTQTAQPAAPLPATATATELHTAVPDATVTSAPTVTPVSFEATEAEPVWRSYWPFGLMVVALIAIGAFTGLRRA